MPVDYSQVLDFKRKFEAGLQRLDREEIQLAETLGQLAVRTAKLVTPVDSGDLRASWDYDIVKKGGHWEVRLYNPMDYALYVDKGHRIVTRAGLTVGWQEGVFMIKYTEDKMQDIIPHMVEDLIAEVFDGL